MVEIPSFLSSIPLFVWPLMAVLVLLGVGFNKLNESRYRSIIIYSPHAMKRARGRDVNISDREIGIISHAARLKGWGINGKHTELLRGTNKFFLFGPAAHWDAETAELWAGMKKRLKVEPSLPIVALISCGIDSRYDEYGKPKDARTWTSKSRDYDDLD